MQLPADRNAVLRRLPKVDEVLASPAVRGLLERAPRWAVVAAVREVRVVAMALATVGETVPTVVLASFGSST